MAELLAELDVLDGEQLYNLIGLLITAEHRADLAEAEPGLTAAEQERRTGLATELTELRCLALAEVARITVPIREAVSIIYRARFARKAPQRVPGT